MLFVAVISEELQLRSPCVDMWCTAAILSSKFVVCVPACKGAVATSGLKLSPIRASKIRSEARTKASDLEKCLAVGAVRVRQTIVIV